MTPNPFAVLWDLDGTLVNSEEYHWRAWQETLRDKGISITHQNFLASFGQRNDAILGKWLGASATPAAIERIGTRKEARYRELVRLHGTEALPGAAYWIERLYLQGWLQAIASSAPRENVETILDVLQFRPWLQTVVAAEDVRAGKPDPEVFLTAAARLGAAPSDCIVVEDARVGIEAARRAGMQSIAVGPAATSLGADKATSRLADLPTDAFSSMLSSFR